MGCDIHLFVEVKIDGQWELYSQPYVNRDYRLFSRMAGVRRIEGFPAISQPKGLPPDITKVTRKCREYWQGDGHSESWLSGEELVKLDEMAREPGRSSSRFGYILGNSVCMHAKYPQDYPDWIQDVRMVFWFDN